MDKDNEYKIRKAAADDMDKVAEIAIAAWKPIYEGYLRIMGEEMFQSFYAGWEERKTREIRDALGAEKWSFYVTEKDGKIAGFVTYRQTGEKGEICSNAVHPGFQGKGIGSMQYRFVLERMKEEGVKYVKVSTGGDEGHAAARRAYEKAGFDRAIPSVTYFMKIG